MMHTIIGEGLHTTSFIEKSTKGFEELWETIKEYSAERVSPVCGIATEIIKEIARLYATAKTAIIFWGWGYRSTSTARITRAALSRSRC